MTPKEKANELANKFFIKNVLVITNEELIEERKRAKQCALIAVDEIEKAINFDWMEVQNLDREHNYWHEVKQEIHLL